MRIISEIKDYIENQTQLEITDVDTFNTTRKSAIMIQQSPSSFVETRYYDESRNGTFEFDILAKNANSQVCVSNLEILENLLDLPNGLSIEYGRIIECKTIKPATKVGQTDKNLKIYSSSFSLEYHVRS